MNAKDFNLQKSFLTFGNGLIIDEVGRQVFLKEESLSFTKKEFNILLLLATNPNCVFPREQLCERILEEDAVFNIGVILISKVDKRPKMWYNKRSRKKGKRKRQCSSGSRTGGITASTKRSARRNFVSETSNLNVKLQN